MLNPCETVLVVEDDEAIQMTLKAALEFEGYNVKTANNGKEALEILRTAPSPCLILLDLMMPIMSGWKFLETRRVNDVLMTIPVAVVSAAADIQIKEGDEVQTVIRKPIDLNILLDWVRQFCGKPKVSM